MTDRIEALTVVLDAPTREDDLDALIAAIKQLRGVADVGKHVASIDGYIAQTRATQEVWRAIFDLYERQRTKASTNG